MDEFISYMDVSNGSTKMFCKRKHYQNKIKELITTQTESYLKKLQEGNQVIGIDTEYYFNTGGKNKGQDFWVNFDWETAKKTGRHSFFAKTRTRRNKNLGLNGHINMV